LAPPKERSHGLEQMFHAVETLINRRLFGKTRRLFVKTRRLFVKTRRLFVKTRRLLSITRRSSSSAGSSAGFCQFWCS
jgi:hypothetical protein